MNPPPPNPNVRLQNLRDFTVQIRRANNAIVGTGIAVSMNGHIVTCAHVVRDAGIPNPRQPGEATVMVYFPQVKGGEAQTYRATVTGCFPQHDDDVVLLQLTTQATPLGPEKLAVLGHADDSFDHPFRSYGYRRLDKYLAGHAHGLIHGDVEPPDGLTLHADPVQLSSPQLNQGMSGAAVLDTERNLVVGLVSEVYFPYADGRDRDTGWGVNARVLSLEPLHLPLQDVPLPKQAAPQPQVSLPEAKGLVARDVQFHSAPPPLAEWVGRQELLDGLTRDRDDPDRLVTGLIGFGGEGKSSLARRWVDTLLGDLVNRPDDLPNRPTGVFWWGFYDKPSVDEFFEAALEFISDGKIDPRVIPSASTKAQVIADMLRNGNYLFVLDGLEILQHQDGDEYGLLRSNDLRTFLHLFAAPGHHSFCLVTSRAPLLDLMAYTTYTHRDVSRVTPEDGRKLLRALGVEGRDGELDKVVNQWDGHALTLSLVGTYAKEWQSGRVAELDSFDPVGAYDPMPVPEAAKSRYEHVHRVLRRYDEHITAAERAFLTLFSAFRTPVKQDAFDRVFRTKTENPPALQQTLAELTAAEWAGLVQRLVAYRLVRTNESDQTYTTHPLVRNHYLARLTQSGQAEQTHSQLKDYYLALAGDTPQYPTLDNLAPLIEVVYHACRAGAYDEAYQIHDERINQKNRFVLMSQLGSFETELALMQQFFPDGDTYREPQVSKPHAKGWILNMVGGCQMNLGRLAAAAPFYERAVKQFLEQEDWHNASRGYQNLAHLTISLGRLAESAAAAAESLTLARRAENKQDERNSLKWQAWAAHLRGEVAAADEAFQAATVLEQAVDSGKRYLYSLRGIQHADHLRRTGQVAAARQVTIANLEICQRNRWANTTSMCHRVLGDLDAAEGQYPSARVHYDEALKIARSISHRPALIEALLARGRWLARFFPDLSGLPLTQAFSDLQEALSYATEGGYRLYEADIRIALAWAHHTAGDPHAARAEASRALTLSQEMGYHWGQVDAGEVLGDGNS
jgi:tetratricopeptide (TPR) repeat protein